MVREASEWIHTFDLEAEFEHDSFRCRILNLPTCGDPECACMALAGEPLRVFIAPFRGTTDEWWYMGHGDDLDNTVAETADTISADLEAEPTIFDRTCVLLGVDWPTIMRDPQRVIRAHQRQAAGMDAQRTRILLNKSIAELRKIRAQTKGRTPADDANGHR